MRTVNKLKKRSIYALGLIMTLVFSYVFKSSSESAEENSILTKIPQALADVPPPPPSDGGDGGGGSASGGGGDGAGSASGDGGGGSAGAGDAGGSDGACE